MGHHALLEPHGGGYAEVGSLSLFPPPLLRVVVVCFNSCLLCTNPVCACCLHARLSPEDIACSVCFLVGSLPTWARDLCLQQWLSICGCRQNSEAGRVEGGCGCVATRRAYEAAAGL